MYVRITIWWVLGILLFPVTLNAQVFQGQQNLLIPPDASSGATQGITISEATVSGVGTLSACNRLERVLININHTYVGDVAIFLISPLGTVLELTSGNGGSAENWTNTEFRDDAPVNIVNGAAPYTGSFRPEGRQQDIIPFYLDIAPVETFTLANTFSGENADGVWQLYVNDYVIIDDGEILNWEMEFSTNTSSLDVSIEVSNLTACDGSPVDLEVVGTISPGTTFAWSTAATTASISVSPSGPTLYRVTVSDGACETELQQLIEPQSLPEISGPTTSCAGETIRLTASGTGPFTWSTGQTGSAIDVDPTTTTTYTVSTGPGPCETSEDFTLTVQPISLFLELTALAVCAGEPVTIRARGGSPTATYQWSTGATTEVITVSPTNSLNYIVTLTEGSCTRIEDITISVVSPVVDLGDDLTICAGQTIALAGIGNGPYDWSTGEVANAILVAPTATTTYTATANIGDCATTDDVVVTVVPAPSVTVGTDAVDICTGDPVVLTATGDGPFSWSDGQTGGSITVSPSTSTNYTVTVGTGVCQTTDEVLVSVTAQPTLDLGGDQIFCVGEATSLTATGSFSNILWSDGSPDPTIALHTIGTQTYTATASNGACSITETVTITINPAPTVTASPDQEICAGEPATLTATGDGPFVWSDGQTGPSIVVSPTVTTTYFVDVAAGACSDFDEVTVTVNAQPTLDLGGDQTFCVGEATSLMVSGSFSDIVWNDGSTEQTIALHAVGTETYTATAGNGTCSVSETVTITINPAPTVTASPDVEICAGEPTTLTAVGDGPFTWSDGQTGPSIVVSPTTTTTYFVDVVAGACADFDEVVVTVNAPPTIDLGGDRTLCVGEANSLTATGNFSNILWGDGAVTPTVALHDLGTVTYTVTANNGNCTATDEATITIAPAPSVSVSSDQTICAGEEITLEATGDGPFTWSDGQIGSSINVSPDVTTTYFVDVVAGTCSDFAEVTVTVADPPTLDLGGDRTLCQGEATSLTATGDFTAITWADGQTSASIDLHSVGTQTYTATVTNGNCTVTESIDVTIIAAPAVTASPDTSICTGDSLTLRATGTGPFTWSTGEVSPSIRVSPDTDASYLVSVGGGNCGATDEVTVTVAERPTIDLGGDQVFCAGEATTLAAAGNFTDILWADGQTTATVDLQAEGTLTYIATAATGICASTDTATISVLAAAAVNIGPDQSLCAGDTLELTAVGTGPFSWNTGFTGATIAVSPLQDTNFIVSVGAGNCLVADTVEVVVRALPRVELGPDLTVCAGEDFTLSSQFSASTYAWSDGSNADSLQILPVTDGDYALTVTTNDCSAADTVNVVVREPAFDLGEDRIICPGDSLILTGPEAEVFAWSTGLTQRILRLAPTADQEITLLATIDGCEAQDTLQVRVTNDLTLSFESDPAICPGDSVTLRPLGTGPFRWSTGEVATEITVQPTTIMVVSATVGAGNCAVTDSVSLTVLPGAMVDLGDDQSLCLGETTDLVPEGDGVSFVWSTGIASSVLPVQPTASVSIGVTAANEAGCTATDTVNLRVVTPRLSVERVPEICPGDSLRLRATEADAYAWETGENSPEIMVAPTVSTVYRVTGFTESCSVTDSVRVTVRPRANVTVGEDQTICQGTETMLSASGDGPFRWSDGSTGPALMVTPAEGETFFAVAGEGNCRDTAFVRVDFFPEVRAELGEDQQICRGDSIALLADVGTASFSWSDGDFSAERFVRPEQTTVYRLAANENGCAAVDSVTVVVNDLPVPALQETNCAPDNLSYSATLTITGGTPPFRVNDEAATGNTVLMGIPSGTAFRAFVTDANGCEAMLSDLADCGCTEIVLAATARGCNGSLESRDLNALLPNGAPTGTWSVLNPDANGRPFLNGAQLSLLDCTAGEYVLQFTPIDVSLDCLPGYQTVIAVEDPPSAGRQNRVEERCAEIADELDLFAELTGAIAGGSWEALSENTVGNPAVDLVNGRFSTADQPPGDYRFRYRAPVGVGCVGGGTEVIVRLVSIEVGGAALPPGCEDACSGSILVSDANPTWLYALNDDTPSAENRFGNLCAGTYQLRAEDDRGCTATTELTIPRVFVPEIAVQGNTELMLGDSTVLSLSTNVPPDSVAWSQAVNCLDPSCLTVSVTPEETTSYTVRFTSVFGCGADTTLRVQVDERVGVYVPTAFSPNGDGVNDLLTVYAGDAILSVENFRLFDRWGGQLVDFERVPLGDASFGWDGRTVDGRALPPAVYVYQLSFTRLNGTTELVTGEVTLMR